MSSTEHVGQADGLPRPLCCEARTARGPLTIGGRQSACPTLIVALLALTGAVALGQKPSPGIASKASLDFEKVDAAPIPSLADTMACVQSNAAAVASARIEERYVPYYRKGYCELFGEMVPRDSETIQAADKDFM